METSKWLVCWTILLVFVKQFQANFTGGWLDYRQHEQNTNRSKSEWALKIIDSKGYLCGNDLLNYTAGISVCYNKVYQFLFDLNVVIFESAIQRYTGQPDQLRSYDGFKKSLFDISSEMLSKGRFDERVKWLSEGFPEEKHRRIWMGLTFSYGLFTWHGRLLLSDRLFLKTEYSDSYLVDYIVPIDFYLTFVINAGTSIYSVTTDIDDEIFLFLGHSFVHVQGEICLNPDGIRLEFYLPDKRCRKDRINRSLLTIFKMIDYGFVLFTQLVFVAKDNVILVDRKLLTTFNFDFPYRIMKAKDFFTCSRY